MKCTACLTHETLRVSTKLCNFNTHTVFFFILLCAIPWRSLCVCLHFFFEVNSPKMNKETTTRVHAFTTLAIKTPENCKLVEKWLSCIFHTPVSTTPSLNSLWFTKERAPTELFMDATIKLVSHTTYFRIYAFYAHFLILWSRFFETNKKNSL